jgi:hypothetical protein
MYSADWYSTFAFLADQDPTDHEAASTGLPPIDSLGMWPYLTGASPTSPRTELQLDMNVLIMRLPMPHDDMRVTTAPSPHTTTGASAAGTSSAIDDAFGYFKLFGTYLVSARV